MLGRHVYRVSPAPGGWGVSKEGEDHPRAHCPTREAAMDEAIHLARADPPARVTLDNGDGVILDEKLFGRAGGADLNA